MLGALFFLLALAVKNLLHIKGLTSLDYLVKKRKSTFSLDSEETAPNILFGTPCIKK